MRRNTVWLHPVGHRLTRDSEEAFSILQQRWKDMERSAVVDTGLLVNLDSFK